MMVAIVLNFAPDAKEGDLRHRLHLPRGAEGQGEDPSADLGCAHRRGHRPHGGRLHGGRQELESHLSCCMMVAL